MMWRRRSKTLVAAAVIGLVCTVLGTPQAGSETAPSRFDASSMAGADSAADIAATLGCARRDGWQRWYATPSVTNVNGVWACGWYNSRIYDLEGKVWSTDPDVAGGYLWIRWGPNDDQVNQVVTASPEGHEFSLDNPVDGTPPRLAECTATRCGELRRVDYLPERNKLAGVFRVMTYNIHHGYTYEKKDFADWCKDPNVDNTDLWKTASTIRRNDPDIVSVNEIHKVLQLGDNQPCHIENQPEKLAQMLDMNYVYCNAWDILPGSGECNHNATTRNSGNAILSRYPITFKGHLGLPYEPSTEHAQRSLIWAEVTVNGTRIPVYSTHLAAGADKKALREKQLIEILRTMAGNGHYPGRTKMIFAGDLNTADVAGELWRLGHSGRGFNDGFKHISPDWAGYTIPVGESRSDATKRVDYIWTSPLFDHPTRGTAVPWSQSSDHLPVIVDMYQ